MVAKDFSLRFATFEMTSINKEQGKRKEAALPPPFSSPYHTWQDVCHSERSEEPDVVRNPETRRVRRRQLLAEGNLTKRQFEMHPFQ